MSNITKKAIAESFKKLLSKKSLTKITVADIAEDCGINRQTFYYHFQDIYDLANWMCIEEADRALKEKPTYETWQEGFLALFELARKDKVFIDNIFRCLPLDGLQQYLYKLVYPLLKGVIDEIAVNYIVSDDDKEWIINFYKYAFVGFMLDWIKNDMRDDPKKIVEKISVTVRGNVEQSLKSLSRRAD